MLGVISCIVVAREGQESHLPMRRVISYSVVAREGQESHLPMRHATGAAAPDQQ